MWSGGCFRVILDTQASKTAKPQSFHGAIIKIDMRDGSTVRINACRFNSEAVILGCDFNVAGFQVLHGLVGTPVTNQHLKNVEPFCKRHQLMPEADTKYGLA